MTPLEMARQHVLRGERLVADQERRVAELRRDGLPSRVAEGLLETFRRLLDVMRDDLARLESIATAADRTFSSQHLSVTGRNADETHP